MSDTSAKLCGSAEVRRAPNSLRFEKCKRGFTLTEAQMDYILPPVYAFDNIEDLVAWLVEQYGD